MKRWVGSLILAAVAGVALAQAPFTIVRPADGAKVREKVRVLIPKGSVPSGGYVGVFMKGKFIEALIPPLNGKYYEYTIDTKARGIEDGPLKLELVLYVDFNEKPRVVDRTSVDLTVSNKASIKVPASGYKLRYNYRPGTEMVYGMTQTVTVSAISESQNRLGGRAAEIANESEKFRLLYAVDNSYGNGDGLVRLQALPDKGKDYAILTTSINDQPMRYYSYDMAPIYMRLTPTGQEVFGAMPIYWPLEGTAGESSLLDLLAAFPLPTLPTKSVRPGDSWQTSFQNGRLELDKRADTNSVVRKLPARGEFVGVEWEMGHPCAKIKHTIEAADNSLESRRLAATGAKIANNKVSVTETVWFALDTRKVLKIVRDQTVEGSVSAEDLGFGTGSGTGGGGAAGAGGGRGMMPGASGPAGGGMGGDSGKDGDADRSMRPASSLRQFAPGGPPPGYQGGPGGPPGGFRGGRGGAPQGFGQGGAPFGGRTGAPAAAQNNFVRVRIVRTFVLER